MSQALKDQLIDAQERICDEYSLDKITLDEAVAALKRLGFDPHEARDLLQEYTP